MVAYITPTPQKVLFTWPDVKLKRARDVSVAWDTGDGKPGQVVVTIDGKSAPPVPAAGAKQGTTKFAIRLDQIATVTLRSPDGKIVYGSSTVTTGVDAFAQGMLDRTFMEHLDVRAGVEYFTVAFDTKGPAVAMAYVYPRGQSRVVSWVIGQVGQRHALRVAALDQGTAYDVRILAARPDNYGKISPSGAPEQKCTVTTGTRDVTVYLDTVYLGNDSDANGSAEMTVYFYVAEALTGRILGERTFEDRDWAGGYPRDVKFAVSLPRSPRQLWVQVSAEDDDTGAPPYGVDARGRGLVIAYVPRWDRESSDYTDAGVTAWVDTDPIADGRRGPLELDTGPGVLSFTASGSIEVHRHPGTVEFPGLRMGRAKRRSRVATARLSPALVAALRAGTHGSMTMTLGPDRELLVAGSAGAGDNGYRVDLGTFPAAATYAQFVPDSVAIYVIDDHGSVLASVAEPGMPPLPWRHLGGDRFAGAVTVLMGDAGTDLFVLDVDGGLWHGIDRGAEAEADWTRIGAELTDVAALRGPGAARTVLARARDGHVRHRVLPGGDRAADGGDWTDLGAAPAGELTATWAQDGSGLIVSVEASDLTGAALFWPDHPVPSDSVEWHDFPPL